MATRGKQSVTPTATVETTDVVESAVIEGEGTLKQNLDVQVRSLDNMKRQLAKQYTEEPKEVVMGSPLYQKDFGRQMRIVINGIALFVPLDGQQYKIPATFAAEFMTRLALVDEKERNRRSLANIQGNGEAYAGERGLLVKA